MQDSVYHSLLRISALTLSLVLLFVSGILSPVTKELSQGTTSYLASVVGITASVTPNEYNSLSAEIAQKQKELDQREIAVNLKEASANKNSDLPTFVMSVMLFVLLVLIVLNYLLDFIRTRKSIVITEHEQAA